MKPHLIGRSAPRLGIIGGGQLARMTALAAARLGCEVDILAPSQKCPAFSFAVTRHVGDWSSVEALRGLAAGVDAVTVENEFVDADMLRVLEEQGHLVCPSASCIACVQDKFVQKQALAAAGLPVPAFSSVETPEAVLAFAAIHGFPLVLKTRRNGYDGRGNATVRSAGELAEAWSSLATSDGGLMVEAFCPFVKELAVMVVRSRLGECVSYPVVESIQSEHVCRTVIAPALISDDQRVAASELALRVVQVVGGTGCLGVELFLTGQGALFVNEIAPRVHNSGHYTIEACDISQFENHVRAVLGLPLGSPRMRVPCAVMVNLLGAAEGDGVPLGLEKVLEMSGVQLHLYGKERSARGRKMGHVTVLADEPAKALEEATLAASLIRFGSEA